MLVPALSSGILESPAFAAGQAAAEPLSKTYRITRARDVEFQKIEPFKVFDNLYYVGPGYVSVWLLTTPEGNILFDSAQEPYVDHVINNIRKVGVDPKSIKYIILSHGHLDHVGGAARIQEASGARVVAAEEDWKMIEQMGGRPGRGGGLRRACRRETWWSRNATRWPWAARSSRSTRPLGIHPVC